MPRSSSPVRPIVVVVIAVAIALVALPKEWKSWAPGFVRSPDFHFGLDLAGGTELDFRISEAEIDKQMQDIESEMETLTKNGGSAQQINTLKAERDVIDQQRQNLVEAIRTVLERRINALGVSEATITPSYIGGEKHLLVDCPGVVDVQKCIATIGKTIQLEFKEEFTEASKEFEDGVRAKAAASLARIRKGEVTLQVLGQDIGTQLGMGYVSDQAFFREQLPKGLEPLWTAAPGGVSQLAGSITQTVQNAQGTPEEQTIPGLFLAQVLSPRTLSGRTILDTPTAFSLLQKREKGLRYETVTDKTLESFSKNVATAIRSMHAGQLQAVDLGNGSAELVFLRLFTPGREEVSASHILVTYKGATGAASDIKRTKEEALARAQALKKQLDAGASFAQLARTESDGPSRQNGGSLGSFPRGTLVPAFEAIAFSQPVGTVSDPVETPFGYHLIRVDTAPHQTSDRATVDLLTATGPSALTRLTAFQDEMQSAKLTSEEEVLRVRFLFFSLRPSGWKDTALDGKHFRSASVTMDPNLNLPVVQITFDAEGASLFQQLTKKNIGKRIAIFVGGELVSAPTVQTEIAGGTAIITGSQSFDEARSLAQDLNTGAIPAPIYLSGQHTVEATLGAQALWTSLKAALIGSIILMIYLIVIYRLLGVIADLALIIYAAIFVALLKLPLFLFSNTYIVLTLAGTAGIILSIGMAVDANVLVFERVKEELRKGKLLRTAIDTGFHRAWPSVRDSNISTLITCAILFIIGTSIVRGFAITLGLGVFVSMLTGMVLSRWIAQWMAGLGLEDKPWLFPGMQGNKTSPDSPRV